MKSYDILISEAVTALHADRPAAAVWRLVDAVGQIVLQHGLETEIGVGQATGLGWQLVRKGKKVPGRKK